MRIVILAAGVGSRLGNPFPKPLTPLSSGETILGRQIRLLGEDFDPTWICAVVGFKKDLIMEEFPDILYVYNRDYGDTNTSKSLLRALILTKDEPVLWLNGDVVFDEEVVDVLLSATGRDESFVCVNTQSVGEEEVKYTVGREGHIQEISKTVVEPLGEAVGINYISSDDKAAFTRQLQRCEPQDYFERGLEMAIAEDGIQVRPLDLSGYECMEIDFQEDLRRALEKF